MNIGFSHFESFLIKQGGINEQAGKKKPGFIIEQAKYFASRVAKNQKIVPEHARLFGSVEYVVSTLILLHPSKTIEQKIY